MSREPIMQSIYNEEEPRAFTIYNYSKEQADCFLIRCHIDENKFINILIDGNRSYDSIKEFIIKEERIDVIIVTHVDDDHINGIIGLLSDDDVKKKIENGILIYNRLQDRTAISYTQGEQLERIVKEKKITMYDSFAPLTAKSCIDNLTLSNLEERKEIKSVKNDNVRLSFLSPNYEEYKSVISNYQRKKRGEIKSENPTYKNKTSITFLLEYKNEKIVFCGDSVWSDIEKKLNGICEGNVSLIKIPHHGAKNNVQGLVEWGCKHNCRNYILTAKFKNKFEKCTDTITEDTTHPCKLLVDNLIKFDLNVFNNYSDFYYVIEI